MSKVTGLRTDIQGLRAIAVLAVVVYHLWPSALPGGYIGVDVFLVISGFLITTHLLQSPPRGLKDLGRFWGRRIRRLLPVSATVIVATAVTGWFILPPSRIVATAREAVTSALYVQNWELARSASDYLASTDEASPFRHFWTLSVEEQFYLLWPILLTITVGVALRFARSHKLGTAPPALLTDRAVLVVVGLVCVASFSYSIYLTQVNPAAAYYVTPTRMWELALGGLVAGAARRFALPTRFRAPTAVAGLLAIGSAAFLFSGATAFPGSAAALPVLGAGAVIFAACEPDSWPGRLLRPAPAQFIGDISYALYLWHWPLIVFAPFVLGDVGVIAKVAIIGIAIGLATATKYTVEDPVRFSPLFTKSGWTTAGLLVAGTGLGAVAGVTISSVVTQEVTRAPQRIAQAEAESPECFGAASVLNGCEVSGADLAMSPAYALDDRTVLYADNCWNNQPYDTRKVCEYGPEDPELRVALVGNSHAGHWFPALDEIAAERRWSLTTYLTSICYPVDIPLDFVRRASTEGCSEWNDWARDEVIAGDYDLIVLSSRTHQALADVDEADKFAHAQAAYGRVLDEFTTAGAEVLVIRDTTYAGFNVPDCVARNGANECSWPRDEGLEPDPQAAAAQAADLPVLDVTDVMCGAETCPAVIGGLIVYVDHGHLTHTFAKTLQPELDQALDEVVLGID